MPSFGAIKAGEAFVEMSLRDKHLRDKLAGVEGRFKSFARNVAGVMASVAVTVGPIAVGIGSIAKAASRANETMNKFRAVFRGAADDMTRFAEALGGQIGRSKFGIMDSLATFQSFFVGLGFSTNKAADFSRQLQKLAFDFASFHNIADDEAVQRFISALSGSSEVLDRFGVNIKQAALQQELLAMGVNKSWTAVTEQEKAVARLNIIMRAMTEQGAVGDAEKTAGSFANRVKALSAAWDELKVTLGNGVIPVLTDVVALLTAATNEIKESVRWMGYYGGGLVEEIQRGMGDVPFRVRDLQNPSPSSGKSLSQADIDEITRQFSPTWRKAEAERKAIEKSFTERGLPWLSVFGAMGFGTGGGPTGSGRSALSRILGINSTGSRIKPSEIAKALFVGGAGAGGSLLPPSALAGMNAADSGMRGLPGYGIMDAVARHAAGQFAQIRQSVSRAGVTLEEAGTSAGHAQRVAAMRQQADTSRKQLNAMEAMRTDIHKLLLSVASGSPIVAADLGAN